MCRCRYISLSRQDLATTFYYGKVAFPRGRDVILQEPPPKGGVRAKNTSDLLADGQQPGVLDGRSFPNMLSVEHGPPSDSNICLVFSQLL